jgi:hypothetical protein
VAWQQGHHANTVARGRIDLVDAGARTSCCAHAPASERRSRYQLYGRSESGAPDDLARAATASVT